LRRAGGFREVFRPTALAAGPIHQTAGFTCPLWFRPRGLATPSTDCSQPDLAGLVSDRLRSWASPFRGCSAPVVERHSCLSGPTWWLETRPPGRTFGTVQRQVSPPLGFAPQACPSLDAGCYPVTGLAPLLGFSSLRFVLRPAWPVLRQASARWLGPLAVTRKRKARHSAYPHRPTIPIRNSPAEASEGPALRQGPDQNAALRFLHLFMTLKLKAVRAEKPDF